MSHHFDTKLAKEDPSLNVCDFYLFQGAPGKTVMAMTVNPDLGLSAPDTLHPEGLYAFRFDLNSDAREELAFKFRFSSPRHADDDDHRHIQTIQVRRATGESIPGDGGETIIEGETGKIHDQGGVRVYAGIAPDLFAGDAIALRAFRVAFQDQRYDGDAFLHRQNYFARRNITAIVLEVPTRLIGQGKVHAWATASLYGHAPEMQVSRWGLPLITHLFLSTSEDLINRYNDSAPANDTEQFSKPIADFTGKLATYAGSAANPNEYGKQVVARLCPITLPYELDTQAAFDQASFNGRPLGDDVMDVMLTLACNKPLADGVAPDRSRMRSDFPYFGEPYTRAEQAGVTPVPRPAR